MEPDFTDPATYRDGLPAAAFGSAGFGRIEDERLWPRCWVCIGAAAEIPDPGDLLPYTVGVHGIHVQRQADGSLVARINKAHHGGCHFIPIQCQNGSKTRCGFTSCGYSLDRPAIKAAPGGEPVPEMYQYLGMRPERLAVIDVREEAGLLFVSVDGSAPGDALPPVPGLPRHASPSRWTMVNVDWKQAAAALADGGVAGAAGACRLAEDTVWHVPNLVLLRGEEGACVVVLQPVAPARTLCRITLFAGHPLDDDAVSSWSARIERQILDCATPDRIGTAGHHGYRWLIDRLLTEPPAPGRGSYDSAYRSHPRFNFVA